MKPEKLIELCKKKTVWIQTHNFPDPDAISTAFGLQKLLEHFGIKSRICHEGQIDKLSSVKLLSLCGIDMHSYDEIESEMKADDMIVLVDCQKNNGNTTDFVGDELAAIDHHPTVVKIDYEYSDLRITGACASIIAEYYKTLKVAPDVKEEPIVEPEPVIEEPASPKAAMYGKAVGDIRLAISLGDRFLYQRELFGQNAELMQKTLTDLNALNSFEEAMNYISRFGWDTESNSYQQFLVTLHRRFG